MSIIGPIPMKVIVTHGQNTKRNGTGEWKNKFPETWQEVILTNEAGEKHIADIRTTSGTVLEFQNSPISSETIRIREQFYKDMVWVINAKPFLENLDLTERKEVELSKFQDEVSEDYSSVYERFEKLQSDLMIKKDSCERSLNNLSLPRYYLRNNVTNLASFIAELEDPNFKIPNLNKKYSLYHSLQKYETFLPSGWLSNVYTLETKVDEAKQGYEQKLSVLQRMEKFQEIEVEGQILKIIPLSAINQGNYQRVILISKAEENQIFKRKIKINSLLDLPNLKNRSEEYHFCMDISVAIATTRSEVESLFNQMNASQESALAEYRSLRKRILQQLIDRLRQEQIEMEETESNYAGLKERVESYTTQWKDNEKNRSTIISHMMEVYNHGETRKQILSNYNDQFVFKWTHERKSWREAKAPIYFDFQDGNLYELLASNILRQIHPKDFIYSYNPDLET
jgi:hypothetical protein